MKVFFLFEAPLNQGTYCDDHKLLIKQDRKVYKNITLLIFRV